ncbi:MAG TPA: (2Fe-2S)-binding protein [Terracidiphilus sp.]|jgi:aerobic-type carbon monoxide dehydrogenase small subunit (CoxS/CutS family)|nr:(2Fe-2S)-binding protein [Terracidiphilus sp.]
MSDSTKPSSPSPDNRSEAQDAPRSGGSGISRRGFLKGAGFTAAGTALLDGVQAFSREAGSATPGVTEFGPGAASVRLLVNGKEHAVEIEPRTTLADALRMHLNMTGTKVICDRGACSGCTVWLDKMPVNSCMTLAIDALGRHVTTIEGMSTEGEPHPLQTAFVKHDALQCGFCTPGMVMSCAALLEKNPHPSEQDVRHAISGNLCRCGTYPKIFSATLEAAGNIRKA